MLYCFLVRLFLSLVFLSFLLPFCRHSRSLLYTGPPSIVGSCSAVVDCILYETKLEFALSRSKLNYWRASKTVSTFYDHHFHGSSTSTTHICSRISSLHSIFPLPLPSFAYIISKPHIIWHHYLGPYYRGILDGSSRI